MASPGPIPPQLQSETLTQFLDRRERELTARASALRGQLDPVEAELVQVRKMRELIGVSSTISASVGVAAGAAEASGEGVANRPWGGSGVAYPRQGLQGAFLTSATAEEMAFYLNKTIKELIVQALLDHFPDGGTATQIRDFIRDAYARAIAPSSLRPQMHRLRTDRVLTHDPSTDLWNLTPEKRKHYTLYNHPSSEKMRGELLADEPSEPQTFAGELKEWLGEADKTK
jgi:hypothetical protein